MLVAPSARLGQKLVRNEAISTVLAKKLDFCIFAVKCSFKVIAKSFFQIKTNAAGKMPLNFSQIFLTAG